MADRIVSANSSLSLSEEEPKHHACNHDEQEINNKPDHFTQQQDLEKQPSSTSPAETGTDDGYITGITLWTTMAALCFVGFLVLTDISIVSTATPYITNDFHSLDQVGWYGAAYQLASSTLQPLTGKLYANFHNKWTFLTFFFWFLSGSLLCGVSVSSNMLIVSRAVAGLGASGLINGCYTIVAACATPAKRPFLIGIYTGVSQFGIVAGPLIGGLFTQFVTWRWCFYINLPIGGAVVAGLLFVTMPGQGSKPPARTVLRQLTHKLDLVGFALFAPWTIMLLLAVQWGGNQYAWNSSVVIGLFCGAGAAFFVWLAWDYHKKEDAMIPLGLLEKRCVWTSCVCMFCTSSAMFASSYYLPLCMLPSMLSHFQGVRGKAPAIAGVFMLPSIVANLITSVGSSRLITNFGYYLPFFFICIITSTPGYGLLSTLSPNTRAGKWIGYQVLMGFGRGCGLMVPVVAVQNTVEPAQISVATAMVMFSQSFGGALFLSLADTIFTNTLRSSLQPLAGEINVQNIVAAGGSAFRKILNATELPIVLDAYSKSIDDVFYLITGLAGVTIFFAWGMGWVDVRKPRA